MSGDRERKADEKKIDRHNSTIKEDCEDMRLKFYDAIQTMQHKYMEKSG